MKLKRSIPYAVHLDGQLLYCENNTLENRTALTSLEGDCRVVSDLENAIARIMTVEADARYVELMISRKLQETGEFDEPVTVIPHWKKRRGRNATDIFFTALPSKRYFQYLEAVSEHKDNLILLPLQSVLMAVLKKFGKHHPIAAVVQYGRYADLLIGMRKKIWFADRVVAFDESEEQINALWETVRTDIVTAGRDHQQTIGKVYITTWIDSGAMPQWHDDGAPEIICLKEQVMMQDGREVKASLPVMIDETSVGHAVATAKDRLFYRASRAIPWLNRALMVMTLILAGAGIGFQIQSSDWQAQIKSSLREVKAIQAKVPETVQAVPYEKILPFVEGLWSSRKLPTYGQILSDVGQGVDAALLIANIKVNYTADKVEIKAYGSANAPFEVAYKAYQALQTRLMRRGYTVTEDRFDTQINASTFVLQFSKEMG